MGGMYVCERKVKGFAGEHTPMSDLSGIHGATICEL